MPLLLVLDPVGTFVFAISGAVVGATRRLDLFGILFPSSCSTRLWRALLGMVTGIGGGMVRDVLVANTPVVLRTSTRRSRKPSCLVSYEKKPEV